MADQANDAAFNDEQDVVHGNNALGTYTKGLGEKHLARSVNKVRLNDKRYHSNLSSLIFSSTFRFEYA